MKRNWKLAVRRFGYDLSIWSALKYDPMTGNISVAWMANQTIIVLLVTHWYTRATCACWNKQGVDAFREYVYHDILIYVILWKATDYTLLVFA